MSGMLSRRAIRMMTDRAGNCQRKLTGQRALELMERVGPDRYLGSGSNNLLQRVDCNELETTNSRCKSNAELMYEVDFQN